MKEEFQIAQPPGVTTDNFQRASAIFGFGSGQIVEFIEGFIDIATNGATYVLKARGTPPPLSTEGVARQAGSVMSFGPRREAGAGWPLDCMWFKSTTPGSPSTVTISGVLAIR